MFHCVAGAGIPGPPFRTLMMLTFVLEYTGACFGYCGIFIQGKSHCTRSGDEMWWDYQDIRKSGCGKCGTKHWGDGCMPPSITCGDVRHVNIREHQRLHAVSILAERGSKQSLQAEQMIILFRSLDTCNFFPFFSSFSFFLLESLCLLTHRNLPPLISERRTPSGTNSCNSFDPLPMKYLPQGKVHSFNVAVIGA